MTLISPTQARIAPDAQRRFSRLLKNVMSAAETRKKEAKKRSLHKVNEHFEPLFDAVSASAIVLQQPARTLGSRLRALAFGTFIALVSLPLFADDAIFRDKLISLGTATTSGTFHLVGTQMCRLINEERSRSLIRCVPYNTVGSDYNVKAVANGDLTMALTNSDIAFNEYAQNAGSGKRNSKLRAVMSLYAKPIMVIARSEANIADVTQLAGHSINLGNVGSGQRHLVNILLKAFGLTKKSFTEVYELNATRMGEAFCQGKVDVIVESLGNPSPFYKKMIEECNGVIVSFPPDVIAKLLMENPLMSRQEIPGGIYSGYAEPIAIVGDRAMLVTSADVSDEAIHRFVESLVDNLSELKQSTQELNDLDPDKLFSEGIHIPLHPGVIHYLKSPQSKLKHVDFLANQN